MVEVDRIVDAGRPQGTARGRPRSAGLEPGVDPLPRAANQTTAVRTMSDRRAPKLNQTVARDPVSSKYRDQSRTQ